jgi:hypothetical protein
MEHLIKPIAFYLPQFHEIPENNDAWGNGFTEWVNVKKAKKYYDWQRQPRVPLNNNYYNLLEKSTLEWQCELARSAGIYGFCIYHYWFKGRMVLEKPVEILKSNPEIKINFCFAWANEQWTKTWHGAGGQKEILIPQTYGGREEWEEHYLYFRKYFFDDRYIKENGCPMIVIYRLRNIPEFNQMIQYWNQRAKEDGFKGIYLISMNTMQEHVYKSCWVNGSVDFEPNRSKYEILNANAGYDGNKPLVMDYADLCKKLLERKHDKGYFRTAFIDYDDTPRRKEKGLCCINSSPELFERLLKESIKLSYEEQNDYLFLNAWNEWGEGNYLEPDMDYGMRYLDIVRKCRKEKE